MEETNMGMDPKVTKYFKKIINSFSVGLLWMVTVAIAGLGFGLALVDEQIAWYNIAYYAFFLLSFVLLLLFYYRTWK